MKLSVLECSCSLRRMPRLGCVTMWVTRDRRIRSSRRLHQKSKCGEACKSSGVRTSASPSTFISSETSVL
ncbi:hypothetical protein Q7C36_019215 [Tachysurus vachellii]|uniref:Uncharacterized protein n=1 Tax=Tachysurus vachellii TaxID=175792 RepID=A0AA88SAG8_TACVA|nr:hypothetical protein Q7C36_019215 [Tachysurus vachellii]